MKPITPVAPRAQHDPAHAAGWYTPLAAGEQAVAFLRGDSVLAATGLRADAAGTIDVPAGTWRDALAGGEQRLAGPVAAAELLGEHGIALLERTG